MRVMVLEGYQDNLIEIPDSSALIPIPPPRGSLLVEIQDGTDDEANQAVVEDLAEGQYCLEGVDTKELELVGEVYEEGETILDVMRWLNQRDEEIPRYLNPPNYFDPGYTSDH